MKLFIYFFLFSFCILPASYAELDTVEQKVLDAASLPLRWDNVERSPDWFDGVRPAYRQDLGIHTIRLEPGDSTMMRLPRFTILRLFRPAQRVLNNDVDVSVSNGSGIYQYVTLRRNEDDQTLFLVGSNASDQLINIARANDHDDAIEFAVFISRLAAWRSPSPYRELLTLEGETTEIKRSFDATGDTFWRLGPSLSNMHKISILGPARLAFENRYQYPSTESRTFQAYRINLDLDDKPWRTLTFDTNVDSYALLEVDGAAQLLSRLEVAYLDIPEGNHTLTMASGAPLYARLLRQDQPDYLLPELNRFHDQPSGIETVEQEPADLLQRRKWIVEQGSLKERERLTRHIVKDNSSREGGLIGTHIIADEATRRPESNSLTTLADRLRGAHTFYRALLPRYTGREKWRFRYFQYSRTLAPTEWGRSWVVAEQHVAAAATLLPSGFFNQAPNTSEPALVYPVPKLEAPSVLRVAVNREAFNGPADILVQFDQQPPIKLRALPTRELTPTPTWLGVESLGLMLLNEQHHRETADTQDGPFSLHRESAPLQNAGIAELPLPPTVSEIRLWRAGSSEPRVEVALHYRASKPYQLSESAYLTAQNELEAPSDESESWLATLLAPEPPLLLRAQQPTTLHEIVNHWRLLARLLRSQRAVLIASVSSNEPDPSRTQVSAPYPAEEIATLINDAKQHSENENWLNAFETWTMVANRATGDQRRNALVARIRPLQRLGEVSLANQLLRGMFLHGEDETLRALAGEQLVAHYASVSQHEAQQAVLATMLLRRPNVDTAKRYMAGLLEAGKPNMALVMGLALPHDQQPLNVMIQAAYQARWWWVFDNFVNRLSDEAQRHLWRGYEAQYWGRYTQAVAHWHNAGVGGGRLADSLEHGLRIETRLRTGNVQQRESAIVEWEQWQTHHPGPFGWQTTRGLVTHSSGGENVYVVERDLYFNTFRATRDGPVKLSVYGPVQLKFQVRPVHSTAGVEPVDGWIQLRDGNDLFIQPVNANRPARGVALVGKGEQLPGRKVTMTHVVEAGLHELELSAGDLPILVEILARRPQLPLAVLPPLTPEGVKRTMNNAFGSQPRSNESCVSTKIEPPIHVCRQSVNNADSARGDRKRRPLANTEFYIQRINRRRQTLGRSNGSDRHWLDTDTTRAAVAIKETPKERDFSADVDISDSESVRERMIRLLWWAEAEHDPAIRHNAIIYAESLLARNPHGSGLKAIFNRLSRDAKWELIGTVESSAGLRRVPLSGWQPESAAFKVRKVLLGLDDPNVQVLTGVSQWGFSMTNVSPVTVELELAAHNLPFQIPDWPQLRLELNDTEIQVQDLTQHSAAATLTVDVPRGQHTLRLSIVNPVVNQFVSLRVRETIPGTATQRSLLPRITRRYYHVATDAEPVQLRVAGPAWLRIDELRGTRTTSRYRLVTNGWQLIDLRPEAKHSQGLFRLYRRTLAEQRPELRSRMANANRPSPMEPLVEPSIGNRRHAPLAVPDQIPLGDQEDGTWSFDGKFVSRRQVDEDSTREEEAEQFLQFSATHRFFAEPRHHYWHSTIFGRFREHGGTVIGLKGGLHYFPKWHSWRLALGGQLLAQDLNNDTINTNHHGEIEWAGLARAVLYQQRKLNSKTIHRPAATLFQRWLSMNKNTEYPVNALDQDVFTQYKADHRRGLRLSDTLVHRPWLDTKWYGGVALMTNENLNPFDLDYVGGRIGWRQLAGPMQVGLEYGLKHYFADADRSNALNRSNIVVNLDWQQWQSRLRRWQVHLQWRHDFHGSDNSFFLSLTWHGGNGRGFRDFRPGEEDFMWLRQWQSAKRPINSAAKEMTRD